MSKQTPAPWGYTYDGSGTYSIGPAEDPQGAAIATIHDHDDERAKANARLMVAAPALLGALQALLNSYCEEHKYHGCEGWPEVIDARDAIAGALAVGAA